MLLCLHILIEYFIYSRGVHCFPLIFFFFSSLEFQTVAEPITVTRQLSMLDTFFIRAFFTFLFHVAPFSLSQLPYYFIVQSQQQQDRILFVLMLQANWRPPKSPQCCSCTT